jgi:hypothetical protein
MMKLIYRGHTYDFVPAEPKPYVKPRVLNWRFRAPGESYRESIAVKPYIKPRALNWRFQTDTY